MVYGKHPKSCLLIGIWGFDGKVGAGEDGLEVEEFKSMQEIHVIQSFLLQDFPASFNMLIYILNSQKGDGYTICLSRLL